MNVFRKIEFILLKKYFYHIYSQKSLNNGIEKIYCILSFDCDAPLDSKASLELTQWLKRKGIPAVFAVPGQTLIDHSDAYVKIFEKGFEFINHGYLRHAKFDDDLGKYVPRTFYNKMDNSNIREDIINGHNTIKRLLNVEPIGFRAPHFGSYQSEHQVLHIYKTIHDLNYKYASTTVPEKGLQYGSKFKAFQNIFEFPLSGWFDFPYRILDSNSCLFDTNSGYTHRDYKNQFMKMVNYFSNSNRPGILNFYTDPSQVYKFDGFFDCINYALKKNVNFTTYSKLIT